jgi:hypothetical protein
MHGSESKLAGEIKQGKEKKKGEQKVYRSTKQRRIEHLGSEGWE